MIARLAAIAFAATLAAAIDSAQWPPPSGVQTRMRELQAVLGSRESTPPQPAAEREQPSHLLKSPAGQTRGRTTDENPTRPARAQIQTTPSEVRHAQTPPITP